MDLVSTTLMFDRERTLTYDYDAIDRLANLPLARRGGRSPIELWAAANGLDTKALAMMLWAGWRGEDRNLTLDETEKIIRQAVRSKRVSYRQINECLNAAISQSDVLGIFQPNDDASPENPTPPTSQGSQKAWSAGASEPPAA